MVDLRRRCPECGRQFRPRKGTRRLYCETCRPPRERASEASSPVILPGGAGAPGPIEVAAVAELDAAGRLATVEGQLVVRLAREADGVRTTGTQLSAVADRLLKAKVAALAGAERAGDLVDDLMERRRARRSG